MSQQFDAEFNIKVTGYDKLIANTQQLDSIIDNINASLIKLGRTIGDVKDLLQSLDFIAKDVEESFVKLEKINLNQLKNTIGKIGEIFSESDMVSTSKAIQQISNVFWSLNTSVKNAVPELQNFIELLRLTKDLTIGSDDSNAIDAKKMKGLTALLGVYKQFAKLEITEDVKPRIKIFFDAFKDFIHQINELEPLKTTRTLETTQIIKTFFSSFNYYILNLSKMMDIIKVIEKEDKEAKLSFTTIESFFVDVFNITKTVFVNMEKIVDEFNRAKDVVKPSALTENLKVLRTISNFVSSFVKLSLIEEADGSDINIEKAKERYKDIFNTVHSINQMITVFVNDLNKKTFTESELKSITTILKPISTISSFISSIVKLLGTEYIQEKDISQRLNAFANISSKVFNSINVILNELFNSKILSMKLDLTVINSISKLLVSITSINRMVFGFVKEFGEGAVTDEDRTRKVLSKVKNILVLVTDFIDNTVLRVFISLDSIKSDATKITALAKIIPPILNSIVNISNFSFETLKKIDLSDPDAFKKFSKHMKIFIDFITDTVVKSIKAMSNVKFDSERSMRAIPNVINSVIEMMKLFSDEKMMQLLEGVGRVGKFSYRIKTLTGKFSGFENIINLFRVIRFALEEISKSRRLLFFKKQNDFSNLEHVGKALIGIGEFLKVLKELGTLDFSVLNTVEQVPQNKFFGIFSFYGTFIDGINKVFGRRRVTGQFANSLRATLLVTGFLIDELVKISGKIKKVQKFEAFTKGIKDFSEAMGILIKMSRENNLDKVADDLGKNLPKIMQAISKSISMQGMFSKFFLTRILVNANNFLNLLQDALFDALNRFTNMIQGFFYSIIFDMFSGIVKSLGRAIVRFGKMIEGLISGFFDIIEHAFRRGKRRLMGQTSDPLGLKDDAKKSGKAMIDGLEEGTENAKQVGIDLGQDVIDGTEEVLEIKSPSKWAFRVGKLVITGFVNGIEASLSLVANVSKKLLHFFTNQAIISGFINAGKKIGSFLIDSIRDSIKRGLTFITQDLKGQLNNLTNQAKNWFFTGTNLIQTGFQRIATGGLMGFFQKGFISEFADFDKLISLIKVFGGINDSQVDSVRETIFEFSKMSPYAPNEVAQAFLDLQKAGLSVSDTLKTLPNVINLAVAGEMELAEASTLVTQIMVGFGLTVEDTERIVNTMAGAADISTANVTDLGNALAFVSPIASAAGVTLEEVSGALAFLSSVGIDGVKAGTGLRAIIQSLISPTKEAGELLNTLGIETANADGTFRSLEDIMGQFAVSIEGLRKKGMGEAEILEFISGIGDVQARTVLLKLIQTTEDGTLVYTDYLKALEGANKASTIAAEVMESLRGVLGKTTAAFKVLIFKGLKPFSNLVLKPILKGLTAFFDIMSNLPEGILAVGMGIVFLTSVMVTLQGVMFVMGGLFIQNLAIPLGMTAFALTTLIALFTNPIGLIAVLGIAVVAVTTFGAVLMGILTTATVVFGGLAIFINDFKKNSDEIKVKFEEIKDKVQIVFDKLSLTFSKLKEIFLLFFSTLGGSGDSPTLGFLDGLNRGLDWVNEKLNDLNGWLIRVKIAFEKIINPADAFVNSITKLDPVNMTKKYGKIFDLDFKGRNNVLFTLFGLDDSQEDIIDKAIREFSNKIIFSDAVADGIIGNREMRGKKDLFSILFTDAETRKFDIGRFLDVKNPTIPEAVMRKNRKLINEFVAGIGVYDPKESLISKILGKVTDFKEIIRNFSFFNVKLSETQKFAFSLLQLSWKLNDNFKIMKEAFSLFGSGQIKSGMKTFQLSVGKTMADLSKFFKTNFGFGFSDDVIKALEQGKLLSAFFEFGVDVAVWFGKGFIKVSIEIFKRILNSAGSFVGSIIESVYEGMRRQYGWKITEFIFGMLYDIGNILGSTLATTIQGAFLLLTGQISFTDFVSQIATNLKNEFDNSVVLKDALNSFFGEGVGQSFQKLFDTINETSSNPNSVAFFSSLLEFVKQLANLAGAVTGFVLVVVLEGINAFMNRQGDGSLMLSVSNALSALAKSLKDASEALKDMPNKTDMSSVALGLGLLAGALWLFNVGGLASMIGLPLAGIGLSGLASGIAGLAVALATLKAYVDALPQIILFFEAVGELFKTLFAGDFSSVGDKLIDVLIAFGDFGRVAGKSLTDSVIAVILAIGDLAGKDWKDSGLIEILESISGYFEMKELNSESGRSSLKRNVSLFFANFGTFAILGGLSVLTIFASVIEGFVELIINGIIKAWNSTIGALIQNIPDALWDMMHLPDKENLLFKEVDYEFFTEPLENKRKEVFDKLAEDLTFDLKNSLIEEFKATEDISVDDILNIFGDLSESQQIVVGPELADKLINDKAFIDELAKNSKMTRDQVVKTLLEGFTLPSASLNTIPVMQKFVQPFVDVFGGAFRRAFSGDKPFSLFGTLSELNPFNLFKKVTDNFALGGFDLKNLFNLDSKNISDKAKGIGVQLIAGYEEGLSQKETLDALYERFVSGDLSFYEYLVIKYQIQSPSKLMMEVGKSLIDGLSLGIINNIYILDLALYMVKFKIDMFVVNLDIAFAKARNIFTFFVLSVSLTSILIVNAIDRISASLIDFAAVVGGVNEGVATLNSTISNVGNASRGGRQNVPQIQARNPISNITNNTAFARPTDPFRNNPMTETRNTSYTFGDINIQVPEGTKEVTPAVIAEGLKHWTEKNPPQRTLRNKM